MVNTGSAVKLGGKVHFGSFAARHDIMFTAGSLGLTDRDINWERSPTKDRLGSSPATCDHHRRGAESLGITQIIFEIAACDCTCEWWGDLEICEDTRPSPNRRPFPTLSHRINVLTPISCPYGS